MRTNKKRKDNKRRNVRIALFVVLVAAFFWLFKYAPLTGDASPLTAMSVASQDELVLLVSDNCATCDSVESDFSRVAERAGIEFRKMAYSQKIPVPSYIVVVDGVASIGSARDGEELAQQLCVTSRLKRVCGFKP